MPDEIQPDNPSLDELSAEGGIFGTPWDRRTLLKGAALGTAVAAMYEGGSLFAPLAAFGNDLSTLPCTAQDVQINGPGVITNEPCTPCTGTFTAIVAFPVTNTTSADRYCIGLHLPDGTDIGPLTTDPSGDINQGGVSTAAANTTTTLYGRLPGVSCTAGIICFGAAGTTRGKCAAGTCATVAWSTDQGSKNCGAVDTKPPGGQCRHQQICVVGYAASLTCKTAADCSPPCGSSSKLVACVTANPNRAPLSLSLSDGTNVVGTATITASDLQNGTNDTACHEFTVTASTTTTYTLTVTDSTPASAGGPCTRTASVVVTPQQLSVSINVSGAGSCDGVLTFTAQVPSGCTGATNAWTIDGVAAAASNTLAKHVVLPNDGSLEFRWLDGNCHTIGVTSTCSSSCHGSASKLVCQCAHTTQDCTAGTTCTTCT